MNKNNIDWKEIYKQEFFSSPNCWESCDSYCCKNFHGKHFNMLNKEDVILPFLPGEYEYFKSIGGIKNIKGTPKEHHFTLPNGVSFSIYFLTCKCKGLCAPHSARPIICRIYPYFPIVNAKGEILGFDYSSLMDIFYKDPQKVHPCTLIRERSENIKKQLKESLPSILKYPQIIFIFMAVKILVDSLREAMGGYIDQLSEDELKKFFSKYEWNVLSAKCWKTEKFKHSISSAYEKVKKIHGEFDL